MRRVRPLISKVYETRQLASRAFRTWFPLVLTKALDDHLIDLPKLIEMCSTAPAKFYQLTPRKGGIWPGADADLNIIDPGNRTEVKLGDMHDQSDFTIYEGQELVFPELTLVGGDIVCKNGEINSDPGDAEFLSRPAE